MADESILILQTKVMCLLFLGLVLGVGGALVPRFDWSDFTNQVDPDRVGATLTTGSIFAVTLAGLISLLADPNHTPIPLRNNGVIPAIIIAMAATLIISLLPANKKP